MKIVNLKCINFFLLDIIVFLLIFNTNLFSKVEILKKSVNNIIVNVSFSDFPINKKINTIPRLQESFFIYSDIRKIDIQTIDKKSVFYPKLEELKFIEDISIGNESDKYLEISNKSIKIINSSLVAKESNKFIFKILINRFNPVSGMIIKSIKLKITALNIDIVPDKILYSNSYKNIIDGNLPNKEKSFSIINNQKIQYSAVDEDNKKLLKIILSHNGIYSLSGKKIRKAGWDITDIDPKFLTLSCRGREVPLMIEGEADGSFDSNDKIIFWGKSIWFYLSEDEKCLDIYSDSNVYWLEIGDKPGARIGTQPAYINKKTNQQIVYPTSFPMTLHLEKDDFFQRLPYDDTKFDNDHWLYSGKISGGEKLEFLFNVEFPYIFSTKSVWLNIKLRGQCQNFQENSVDFFINNHYIGSESWYGNNPFKFQSNSISPSYLIDGANYLTVINKTSSELFANLFLDWFEITYPRELLAQNNLLMFSPPENSKGKIVHFEIEGFSDSNIYIFKENISHINNPFIESFTDTLGNTNYTISFEDRIVDKSIRYYALSRNKMFSPDSISLVEDTYLKLTTNGADYIMIVPNDTLAKEQLQDLITIREQQNYKVVVADLQNIFNEFNYGIPNPKAINNFLKYALLNWNPSPKFVLLVGDGIINQKGKPEQGNLIPVPLYQTIQYGASPSDYEYSLLINNDLYADIAIGRLPVRNQNELKIAVQKICNYELSTCEEWNNNYLLISSGTMEGNFGYQAENIIRNIMPHSLHPERLYLSGSFNDPFLGGTEDLLRYFRNGMSWINFRGHGGGAIWSDGGLLDLDDIPLLENRGKLPFITSMTCFTGDFASSRKSLGEALFLSENSGAAAFFGSTGLGWVWNDYYLLKEFLNAYNSFPDQSLGELINKAKSTYLLKMSNSLAFSQVHQFCLLGDPALKLLLPSDEFSIFLEAKSLGEDGIIKLSGTSSEENINIKIEITDDLFSQKYSKSFSSSTKNWETEIIIPQDLPASKCGVRAYTWIPEGKFQERGFSSFAYRSTYFDSLHTIPRYPVYTDSISFIGFVEDLKGLQDVNCIIETPLPDTLKMYKDKNFYKTRKISPFAPGSFIKYHINSVNSDRITAVSQTEAFSIPDLPDLTVESLFFSGDEDVKLCSRINNFGGSVKKNIIIEYKLSNNEFCSRDTLKMNDLNVLESSVIFYPQLGKNNVNIILDPDSLIKEKNENNNKFYKEIVSDRFYITPELGSTINFESTDTVGLENKLSAIIFPGSIDKKTTIFFEIFENAEEVLSDLDNFQNREIVRISFPGLQEDIEFNKNYLIFYHTNPADSSDSLKPYFWNNRYKKWILSTYSLKSNKYIIETDKEGFYQLQTSDDITPPYISVELDNQPFASGNYVSSNPLFTILLQDESGIDLNRQNINISIDNNDLPYTDFIMPDSTENLKNISIGFRPELEPGSHILNISARDIHGNINQTNTIEFNISSSFEIKFLGNHPNPFRVNTVFVFILTDAAEQVILKIYTVSGKLIRTLSDNQMTSPDYHEIIWNGKDSWGNICANGVYFFKLTAKGFNKTQEIKGKIAKIR